MSKGSYAYSRAVMQGSVMVSCHCVLLLASKAMLEQFQMPCFGGSKFSHPISLDACCTSCYLTAPISSGPRLSICMHFVSGIFSIQGFFLKVLSYLQYRSSYTYYLLCPLICVNIFKKNVNLVYFLK